MLNALRLTNGFEVDLFIASTGLSFSEILPAIQKASQLGLINLTDGHICPTERGFQYHNDLQSMFLDLKISKNQPLFSSEVKFIHN
jgi:oxygen-independent coproporphyrinogen-3 oxidase